MLKIYANLPSIGNKLSFFLAIQKNISTIISYFYSVEAIFYCINLISCKEFFFNRHFYKLIKLQKFFLFMRFFIFDSKFMNICEF